MSAKVFSEYRGMSYEQASREGERLSQQPSGWYRHWDRLVALRDIMQCGLQRGKDAA